MSTFSANDKKRMAKAVREHFPVPPDVAKQAAIATEDLYSGPVDADDEYSGFTSACAIVGQWFACNVSPVYWDGECEQLSETPWEGDETNATMLDYPELKKILFGPLADYISR